MNDPVLNNPFYGTGYKVNKLRAIQDRIIVEGIDTGSRISKGGIFIMDDELKERGIRPRWGKVYAVGPKSQGINVGDWVLVEHGRWTRGLRIVDDEGNKRLIRMVDPNCVMAVHESQPDDYDM